jgi:hypothetical protein
MNVLLHWLPTIVGSVILAIVGFILLAKVEREEREAQQNPGDKPTSGAAGAP